MMTKVADRVEYARESKVYLKSDFGTYVYLTWIWLISNSSHLEAQIVKKSKYPTNIKGWGCSRS